MFLICLRIEMQDQRCNCRYEDENRRWSFNTGFCDHGIWYLSSKRNVYSWFFLLYRASKNTQKINSFRLSSALLMKVPETLSQRHFRILEIWHLLIFNPCFLIFNPCCFFYGFINKILRLNGLYSVRGLSRKMILKAVAMKARPRPLQWGLVKTLK